MCLTLPHPLSPNRTLRRGLRFSLLFLVLALFGLSAPSSAKEAVPRENAVLHRIEPLMRAFQTKWIACKGTPHVWVDPLGSWASSLDNANGDPPPDFPPDNFYGTGNYQFTQVIAGDGRTIWQKIVNTLHGYCCRSGSHEWTGILHFYTDRTTLENLPGSQSDSAFRDSVSLGADYPLSNDWLYVSADWGRTYRESAQMIERMTHLILGPNSNGGTWPTISGNFVGRSVIVGPLPPGTGAANTVQATLSALAGASSSGQSDWGYSVLQDSYSQWQGSAKTAGWRATDSKSEDYFLAYSSGPTANMDLPGFGKCDWRMRRIGRTWNGAGLAASFFFYPSLQSFYTSHAGPYGLRFVGFEPVPGSGSASSSCSDCAGTFCTLGSVTSKTGSAEYSISLSTARSASVASSLELKLDTLNPSSYSPSHWKLRQGGNFTVYRDTTNTYIEQADSADVILRIDQVTSVFHRVRVFRRDSGWTAGTSGAITVPGSAVPVSTVEVENPDATGVTATGLLFTHTPEGGSPAEVLFTFASGTGEWTREYDTDQAESIVESPDPTDADVTVETRTLTDGSTEVNVVETYTKAFPWGSEVIKRVEDPAGAARTTLYSYFNNSAIPGSYGRTSLIVRPDGSWTRYEYNTVGQVSKTVSSDLDEAVGALEANSRVVTTLSGAEASLPAGVTREVTILRGVEISRRYTRDYVQALIGNPSPTAGDFELASSVDEIVCTVAGAAYNASTNLVTRRTYYTAGPFAGRLRRIIHPDATLTTYAYELASGATGIEDSETITTTTASGDPNSTGDEVEDGLETETIENRQGHVIAETVTDIASGIVSSQMLATDLDDFGRPTEKTYLDGSSETIVYGCCGIESKTDRQGLTTGYTKVGGVSTETRQDIVTTTTADGLTRTVERTGAGVGASTVTLSTVVTNVAGEVVSSTDAAGGATTHARTVDGTSGHVITTLTLPGGATRIEEYAKDGQLLKLTGTGVRGVAYEYGADADGAFTKETALDAAGAATSEWTKRWTDVAGRQWKSTTSGGALTRSYFNAKGQLVRQVDADDVAVLYGYDDQGRRTVTCVDMDQDGVIDYDGTDRISQSEAVYALRGAVPVLRTTATVWTTDSDDEATETVAMTESSVDGLQQWATSEGLTTHTVRTLGVTGDWTVTTTSPDLSSRVATYTDGRLASEVLKDSAGQPMQATTFGYDAHGRLHTSTDARNGATTYAYGVGDRIASVTTPVPAVGQSAQTTSYTYTAAGQVDVITLPDHTVGQPKQVDYDYFPTGEVQDVSGARTPTAAYIYDHRGRPKTLTTANGVTTWDYFAASGLLQKKTHADTTHQDYTWTAAGRPDTATNGRGAVTTYSLNNAGQASGYTFSDSTPAVSYTFNRLGQMVTATRDGRTRTVAATPTGRVESETHTGGALDGLALTFGYDALLRPDGLTVLSGASTVLTQGYGYGEASRLATATQGNATATYAYAPDSALVQHIEFTKGGVARQREARSHDHLNRLTGIQSLDPAILANPPRLSAAYQYNAANQRTKLTREDGTWWDFGYDALGQLSTGVRRTAGGALLPGWQFGYTFDGIGNRLNASEGGSASGTGLAVTTYTPAAGNLYSSVQTPGKAHVRGLSDPAATVTVNTNAVTRLSGQPFWNYEQTASNSSVAVWASHAIQAVLGANTATGSGHTLVPKATVVPTYDADGNLTHDGLRSFTWDAENRLTKVETDLALLPVGAPAYRVTFGYDDLGRRLWQKAEGRVSGAWQTAQVRQFLFNGWNVVAEFDAASPTSGTSRQLIQSYLWGLDASGSGQGAGGVGGLLVMNDHRPGGSGSHAYAYDGNGNVIGLVSLATGEVSARYDYDPFGRPLGASGPASSQNPFRFSTKYTDPFTGLAYYGYRFYDATAGRWLSRDPLGESGGLNLHGFVGNDPVNGIDALGLELAMSLQTQGAPIVLVPAQNGQLYMYVPDSGAFAPVTWNAPIILHDAGVDLWEGVNPYQAGLLGTIHAFQQVGEAGIEMAAAVKEAMEWWGRAIPGLFADQSVACEQWRNVGEGLDTIGDFWSRVYRDEAFRAAVGESLTGLFDDPATRDKVLGNIAFGIITGRLAPTVARSRNPSVAASTATVTRRTAEEIRQELLGILKQRSRQLELGTDPARGFIAAEGAAGLRLEQALGRTIARSIDPAVDFVDASLGKISLKGPIPSQGDVIGLANAVIKDAAFNSATQTIIIDTFGLSPSQIATLQSAVKQGAGGTRKRIIYLH